MKKLMFTAVAAVLCVAGCNKDKEAAPAAALITVKPAPAATAHALTAEPSQAPAAPATAAAAAPSAPEPAHAAAARTTGYDLAAIKTIPDNCASPSVILATAPMSVGANYPWSVTRQALLANQQFRVVGAAPSTMGEVHLATHAMGASAYALVATCHDGKTCNELGAMYKAIVRTSSPQLYCGKVPSLGGEPVGQFSWAATPQENLPAATDKVASCARLDACMIATDRSTPGDPFVECQKAPHKFRTECAAKYPCAEVMACLAK